MPWILKGVVLLYKLQLHYNTNLNAVNGTLLNIVQGINSRATQQCNMSPYFYAIDWPE